MARPVNHTSPDDLPREVAKVRKKSVVREYAEAILVAVLLALLIRTFVVQAFKIPSGSMIPTLLVGDHILVNKFVYHEFGWGRFAFKLADPARGDVIVFKYPVDETRDFIKRIIAVGGEDLYIRDQKIYVNCRPPEPSCRPIDDPWGRWEDRYGGVSTETTAVHVPPGSYFVMGDNRNNSQDSRYWGFVKREKIKGKAFLIYWSWDSDHEDRPLWDRVRWGRLGQLIH
jgi:signal peptidase I